MTKEDYLNAQTNYPNVWASGAKTDFKTLIGFSGDFRETETMAATDQTKYPKGVFYKMSCWTAKGLVSIFCEYGTLVKTGAFKTHSDGKAWLSGVVIEQQVAPEGETKAVVRPVL